MRHHESTFFCEKGEIPKVVVRSTGDNQAYEAYISFVGENDFTRQITIFFATVDDLREFVDSLVSETYSIEEE